MGRPKRIPSIRSKKPPWPGRTSPVFLTLAFRFKKEINKSPIWDEIEMKNVIKINFSRDKFIKLLINIGIKIIEKTKDPIAPDIVLFGLIFVNFGPLNIFPNNSPPISELIQTNNEYIINNSDPSFLNFILKIIKEKINRYNKKVDLKISLNNLSINLFLINILEINP